ncbi:MAG: DNA-binding protein [Thermoprotei archaeon]|nr:MAG: DNA-binding protein [Thermoprotei archaeon]
MATVEDWIESSRSELKRAEERYYVGDYAYACFHAEQAIQHILKAYLLRHGNFLRIHDLCLLYSRARAYGLELTVSDEELRELTIHYYASRYPDARKRYGIEYTETVAKKAIELARKVVSEVMRCLST